jgi:hypothetical protein
MSREAEFPRPVQRFLADSAGHRCSVPYCHKVTVGPGAQPGQIARSGTACHIYSASKGGPRGTGGLNPIQRQEAENGIWCCANHGRLIDANKGGRYPAGLLKHWKKLHQARIDRENSGLQTSLGWVHDLEIINSVLFRPSTKLRFSKATLISGDGPVGKSTICEWLAGISLPSALSRWRKRDHDLSLNYFSPDAETMRLSIVNGEVNRSLNGKAVLKGPSNLQVIYLKDDYDRKVHREPNSDDAQWIADVLESERDTVKRLCDEIRLNGHPFCRHTEFLDENVEADAEEDDPGRQGSYLYVAADTKPSEKLPFSSLATSEQIATMVQFATALARIQAQHTLTLLVLDAGGWNWCDEMLDYFASYLAEQPYQVVLARAARTAKFDREKWDNWAAVELRRGESNGNNTMTEIRRHH